MSDRLSPRRYNSYSSTVPINDGIDNLAAIWRWVAVDPERSFAEWRLSNLDDDIGVWFACGKTIADFISRPSLVWHTVADVTYHGRNLR